MKGYKKKGKRDKVVWNREKLQKYFNDPRNIVA